MSSRVDNRGPDVAGAQLAWAVLGGGRIAEQFIDSLAVDRPGAVVAVGSRSASRAASLAARHSSAARGYGSYEAALSDPRVSAVYIATPHPSHLDLIVESAKAGLHILCEKPITMNAAEARLAQTAAKASGVALVEAMMYRFQPQTLALEEAIRGGAIGQPRQIEISCSFVAAFDQADRLFDRPLGGGAILDVGCYPVSFARMVAGWMASDNAVQASAFSGSGHVGVTGVEDWAMATMVFPDGFSAHVRTGIRISDGGAAKIYGDAGHITVDNPWTPGRNGTPSGFTISRPDGTPSEFVSAPALPLFAAQIDAVAAASRSIDAKPAFAVDDSVATMEVLDDWREAVGTFA